MPDPINLNRARKARDKARARQRADENAVVHGLGKAERDRVKAKTEKLRAALEAHKREP